MDIIKYIIHEKKNCFRAIFTARDSFFCANLSATVPPAQAVTGGVGEQSEPIGRRSIRLANENSPTFRASV